VSGETTDQFFGELKEWSERKLNILEKYLIPFTQILGSQAKKVYYVDAFAGAGIYSDGAKGSPVRAAELAKKCRDENKSYRLSCINIEANRNNYQNLQDNTASFDADLVLNLHGTFADNADQILNKIDGSAALCFLDPFGVKGIPWELIQKLINRRSPTDFWIRFDYITLLRLAGFQNSVAPGAAKNVQTLLETYGIQDEQALFSRLNTAGDAETKRQNAVAFYMERLKQEFKFTRDNGFAGYYPIKSIIGQDKYFLVFGSGHPKGFILASELICGIEETYQREVEEYQAQQLRQLSLFPSDKPTTADIFQDKVARLKESILIQCANKQLSRIDIYQQILLDWFGKLRATHMTKALNAMVEAGEAKLISGPPSDDRAIYQIF
jgi:three-Cys-motif partner protein